MSINMNAHCDTPHCRTLQVFCMESPDETGQNILDALRTGGWGVQGTFTKVPKTVRLTCPYCMKVTSDKA